MKIILFFLLFYVSYSGVAQSKWHPYGGIHASMDGAGYYVGPSFQAGTDYSLEERSLITAYLHYFPGSVNDTYDAVKEKGKYHSAVLAALYQRQLSKKENRGLFIGLGIAAQSTKEDYVSDVQEIHTKRTILVGAMRFGYAFPFAKKKLTAELNALGPHKSSGQDGPYYYTVTELLTQLSFGVRLVF